MIDLSTVSRNGANGSGTMNGAESLVRTLVAGGVDVCFANPGTSEMYFVAALDRVEGMRCVLGLFEGVVTGAADGYYRMKGTPASTLLHLGPGLANGLPQGPGPRQQPGFSTEAVDKAAKLLHSGGDTNLLLVTGGALTEKALA